jgi:hypothetical protein
MEQNLIKSEIESRIFTIRGMQVMLDKDLAELYGVNTMRLNEHGSSLCTTAQCLSRSKARLKLF